MTVYICQDCGQPYAGLLCKACTATAAALGFTADERLAQLRVVPLDFGEAS